MVMKNAAAIWVLLGFIFLFVYTSYFLIIRYPRWKYELRHINMEIARTEGVEKRAWKCRKRRLLLSLLPFVRMKRK